MDDTMDGHMHLVDDDGGAGADSGLHGVCAGRAGGGGGRGGGGRRRS